MELPVIRTAGEPALPEARILHFTEDTWRSLGALLRGHLPLNPKHTHTHTPQPLGSQTYASRSISPDSWDGELNPTLDWGNGGDTLHKDMWDGRCCGHLWKTQLAHHLSFQICLSFCVRKWHHHSPSYLGQKLRGHAWPLPLSHLPCAIIHQVLSILTPKYLLDPINSHLDYRNHLLSGMYISRLAHPFFRSRFEISVAYLTPFSDLDSGQTPLEDVTAFSTIWLFVTPYYSIETIERRVKGYRVLSQTTWFHILR